MFLVRLKESLSAGVEKLRWISEVLVERLKVEAAVIKLLWESEKMERERDALVREIGERVFELKDRAGFNVLEDTNITAVMEKLDKLDAELTELRRRASEISEIQ